MFGIFRRRPIAGRIRLLKSELRRAIQEKAAAVEECDREADRAADLADELERAWCDRDAALAELAAARARLISSIRTVEAWRRNARAFIETA